MPNYLPAQIATLARRHSNLHAVKESAGDVRRVTGIREITGDRLAIFVGVVWVTRYVSLGSLLATLALPPIAYAVGGSAPAVVAAFAAAAIIVFRHRSNLGRLWTGTERRIGVRVSCEP